MISSIPFRDGTTRRAPLLGWFTVSANIPLSEEHGKDLIEKAMREWCADTEEGQVFLDETEVNPTLSELGNRFLINPPTSLNDYAAKRGVEIIKAQRSPLLAA